MKNRENKVKWEACHFDQCFYHSDPNVYSCIHVTCSAEENNVAEKNFVFFLKIRQFQLLKGKHHISLTFGKLFSNVPTAILSGFAE